jgi:hypothetical protein
VKRKPAKRISTSFALPELEALCRVASREDSLGGVWVRVNDLRDTLKARIAAQSKEPYEPVGLAGLTLPELERRIRSAALRKDWATARDMSNEVLRRVGGG